MYLVPLFLDLLHDLGQLLRHGQANPSGIFDDGDAFVGAVEKDNCGAENTSTSYHMDIKDVCHTYESKDKHLLADALEADGRGQVSLHDGAEDSRHIVCDDECHERIHETVKVTEIFAESRSRSGRPESDVKQSVDFTLAFILKSRSMMIGLTKPNSRREERSFVICSGECVRALFT